MSSRVWSILHGAKARQSWQRLVGYSADELAAHIERQFTAGMTWENIGEWHVDHIMPLAAFVFETPDDPEFRRAWALTNLRPLWAKDNIRKGARIQFLV